MAIWNILLPCHGHSVIYRHFGIFSPRFGTLCQEKSGNPGSEISAGQKNNQFDATL
jgi:hypothetical protein